MTPPRDTAPDPFLCPIDGKRGGTVSGNCGHSWHVDALRAYAEAAPGPLDVERLARVQDALAMALPALINAWDNDRTDNVGVARLILALVAHEYARLAAAPEEGE